MPEPFWKRLVAYRNDVPALLRLIGQQVVDALGDGSVLTTLTDDGAALRPRVVLHTDPETARAMEMVLAAGDTRLGEGLAGTAARERRPVVLNALTPEALTDRTPERFQPFLQQHPIRAVAIVPLLARGELVGTLGAVRTDTDEAYSPADVHLLEALAEQAALAVADAMVDPRALGRADYEAAYRTCPDGMLITTPDGHILAANPAACELLGLTEAEIMRRGRDGIVAPGDARLRPALAERASTGRARSELTVFRGDGTVIEADVSSALYTTPNGRVRACVVLRGPTPSPPPPSPADVEPLAVGGRQREAVRRPRVR